MLTMITCSSVVAQLSARNLRNDAAGGTSEWRSNSREGMDATDPGTSVEKRPLGGGTQQ